ncbi:hypothetical protein [Amaricoccus sp.]|uniref:hypothetical protein n=1 Tax=Amaricoccus sp. TaxID=1872485 RepID=UPI001B7C90BD|nr:hypothetical protein [Amaricoccus sp.]MBP7001335.1 hypothetical protein [Amaricoccus sp.]
MAMTFDIPGRPASPAFLPDLAAALRAGWREWRRRSADRAAFRRLARLDARLLRDMGVDPEATAPFREDPLPFGLRILISRGRYV